VLVLVLVLVPNTIRQRVVLELVLDYNHVDVLVDVVDLVDVDEDVDTNDTLVLVLLLDLE